MCQMWGLRKLPEWGVQRQEVRVLSIEGRSGAMCPDPRVMERAGARRPGPLGLCWPDVGHLLQLGRAVWCSGEKG